MKFAMRFVLCAALLMLIVPTAFAQCGASMLAALDEDNIVLPGQRFDVSVWTNNAHCPASGQIMISTMPPGSAGFGPGGYSYWVESFFDIFTEVTTIKPPVVPMVPPGSPPFQIITEVTFDDPVYSSLTYVETVQNNMMNRLEIFRTTPCTDVVPYSMSVGMSYCFQVCHRVYTIPLATNTGDGQPIISVSPGCMGPPIDFCAPNPGCAPGDTNSFRYEVYRNAGQWYLEFEYSNPMYEPVCYCVRYEGNLPYGGETYVLGGWENERQTMDVSVWTNSTVHPISGTIEIFSYPAGAQFEGGGGGGGGYRIDSFFDIFMEPFTFDPPVGAGTFTPGLQFQLIGYIHYDSPGPAYPPEWVVEDVVVTPSGGLQLVNPGCMGPVTIPSVINPGIPECLIVCHDVYHIPLGCDASSSPTVTVYSGCGPATPCNNIITCTPGAMTDFRTDIFRVGGTWILEFEYSNPQIQPVCYCVDVSCSPTTTPPAFALAAINPEHQTFDVSVWGSSASVPLSGEIHYRSEPLGANFDWQVDSFFDIFLEPFTAEVPVAPGIFTPGQVFQIVADVGFFGPGSDPFEGEVCLENVIVTPSGQLALWDPNSPCTGDVVPSSMFPEQSVCFKVCHRVYEVVLNYLPGGGQPIIHVTPGCTGLNCPSEACVPGGPNDFVYDVYHNGVDWILRFEYSNPYTEPVCYCVTYAGNLPYEYEVNSLAVMNAEMQTLDLTVWTNNPTYIACGTMEVFSYPPGAYISIPSQSFFATSEPQTWHVPVAAGTFDAGDSCMLGTHYNFGPGPLCPEYPDQWDVEYVIYSTQKGARTLHPEISCDPSAYVPEQLTLGVPECMIVCHDVYQIPLAFPGPGIPMVSVSEGCYTGTSCSNPLCDPGLPGEYRYEVFRLGGTWFLEFEHSNPQHVPACYCVTMNAISPVPVEPYLLAALDEAHQAINVSLSSSSCFWPWNADLSVRTNPPGGYIDTTKVQSFFDIFCKPFTEEIPVGPGIFTTGQNFQIIAELDFFGPGSDPFDGMVYTENVMVTPTGLIAWNPEPPCMGDNVPTSMIPGESQCFKVCHRVYETILYYNPGGGRPVIHVTPGCMGFPHDSCTAEACVPGGPNDFVYDVYHDGVNWKLRFEYSNPYTEPVCYCVTYAGNVPWDCETHELAALDEGHMNFDISLRTFSPGGYDCSASGNITVLSYPAGAYIGPYAGAFAGVSDSWHTLSVPVGPGSFGAGQTFQLIAYYDYTDPEYPDVWLTEDVIVEPSGQYLWIHDVGGECTGDIVPPFMALGQSECFKVCHRIYHIALGAHDPANPPTVLVEPGCYGPPQDQCQPDTLCTPGGLFDYRENIWWAGDHWEFEFEYSNENIEPACYCVTVSPSPCLPVRDLVVQWPDTLTHNVRLAWTCPQWGMYTLYSTTVKNNDGNPPGADWEVEGVVWGNTGQVIEWQPVTGTNDLYRNYVIVCDCGPWRRR